MKVRLTLLLTAAALVGAGACAAQAVVPLEQRYDLSRRAARHDLPGRLDEVSGLAFTPDGRLFAHGDERGHVFEIDPRTGEVGKRMEVGARTVVDDFEGIAVAGERFFLVSARGLLYEFREVGDGEESPHRVTDLFGMQPRCEVEGLDYDARNDRLLVACKTLPTGESGVVVHRVPLDPDVSRPPPIRVAQSRLAARGIREIHPSGIAVDPIAGTLVLVAAPEETILEIGEDGSIHSVVELSRNRHPQPEGIAFGPDGTLYIADEQNERDAARLTAYAAAGAPPRRP